MYPLDMKLVLPAVGFALAVDEADHIALTAQGYQPAFVPVAIPAVEKPEQE